MTGGRCHGIKKKNMMGRGADGGCGTEEKPCPISRVPPPPNIPASPSVEIPTKPVVDLYSQARKALCERSPFDVVDDVSAPASESSAAAAAVLPTTLPRGLASFLSRQSDSRKRHKKSHSASEKKLSRQSEKNKGYSLWVETEEYFRPLSLPDIEALAEVSELSKVAKAKCFSVANLGNIPELNGNGNVENVGVVSGEECVCRGDSSVVVKDETAEVDGANASEVVGKVVENGVVEDEVKTEQLMEVDSVAAEEEKKSCSVSDPPKAGIEWLLGYKNKTSLATERPSKKRKVLGADAGLEKVLNGCPCDGNPSLCHFCCIGETGDESNRLIVCGSCKVVVHQKCYGVVGDVDASWLCSWCKHNAGVSDSGNPCVLCSKQGGALKPVLNNGNSGESTEFAHLFCCQWMPEVYIEDMEKVEPIVNVGGIPETRQKLICNICKVKWGACVRCSHGACRTSFHPMCAREAKQRMEIWAKYGLNNVELKAFCPKHSEVPNNSKTESVGRSVSIDKKSNMSEGPHVTSSPKKSNKLKIGSRNGDNVAVTVETSDNSEKFCDSRSQEVAMNDMGKIERSCEDVNSSGTRNLIPILQKLIDCGKVDVKDVALEIGLSPDSLYASLADDIVLPDVQCRIVKWLKDNTYLDLMQKNVKTKLRPSFGSMAKFRCSDIPLSESGISDPVAVKSVPPRRRTKGGVRILKDNKVLGSSEQTLCDNGIPLDKIKLDKIISEGSNDLKEESFSDVVEKNMTMLNGLQNSLERYSPEMEGCSVKPSSCSLLQRDQEVVATDLLKANLVTANVNPLLSVENPVPESKKPEAEAPSLFVDPPIQKTSSQMQNGVPLKNPIHGEGEGSHVEASSNASVCCNHQNIHPKCHTVCKSDEMNLEQLAKARKLGVLEMSPEDEVEGELIYYQYRLQNNITARKRYTNVLICNVAKSLPKEIDAARSQKWDAVLVNQYLCEVREAKKQGRKERRHKEAQAILAAATAAAAASSRISSFRKDVNDESPHQENMVKLSSFSGRPSFSSQMIPRAKEAFPRVAVPRVSVEKHSGVVHSGSDISKEHPRSCDICRRSETMLNPILVCSSCKVAVHLDCYRSARESTGPWYCELCEGKTTGNFWEKEHLTAECGLCGGRNGAFRKSSDGQWVHAFCAEWVFESTFKRGQVSLRMDTVPTGLDFCYICRRKFGVCIKCSYGHCQATFHPYCGRSSDFYMNVKTLGGKQQHKAYCERHSVEQRAKADTQKHGMEELKNLYTIRAELERLRLICERIIKREKVKRELLICSHDLLAVKRDHVARSVLVNSPFLLPDASSESATTSLKAQTDDYRSCSETLQRSDDVTVDSTIPVKHRTRVPITIDNDQRADDDSSTSQNLFSQNHSERMQFSEKQILFRPSVNLSEDGGYRSKSKKHGEMFSKQLVMTSDQASVKNMRLPKGYAYVPADCIPNEKQVNQDACSGDKPEGDG